MTTVLYLMKDNDAESAEDLRLSLRSLDHAFPDDDIRIALATAVPPPWFTGVHVEAHDLPGLGKHWSTLGKVQMAIKTLGLQQPFLLSSDDHIAPLEPPCRIAEWPYLARKTALVNFLKVDPPGDEAWRQSIGWARDVISRQFPGTSTPSVVMCPHRNSWIDPGVDDLVRELFPPETPVDHPGARRGPSPDDVYGALAILTGRVRENSYLKVKDIKTKDPFKFFMDSYLTTKPSGRYGCSIPPGADAVRGPLWRIFRQPSRWERRG